jgi:hypothetical protein
MSYANDGRIGKSEDCYKETVNIILGMYSKVLRRWYLSNSLSEGW